MVLSKYILKSCVVPDLSAANKSDAIKELTHLLFDKKKMKGVGPALDQVLAREMTESTGIGRGIAVPHARVPGIKSLACAVGRNERGIDFLAVDKKPVHLLFLICYAPEHQTTYLNFVATVARVFGNPENYGAIMEAESEDDMMSIIENASETFTEAAASDDGKRLKTDPRLADVTDAHADVILLARLQLYEETLTKAKSGKKNLRERIENIRSLVEPRILKHYDRLSKSRAPALVPVEGDTCQGCFIRLPSKFVQEVRTDSDHIYTCSNCSRYIYVV